MSDADSAGIAAADDRGSRNIDAAHRGQLKPSGQRQATTLLLRQDRNGFEGIIRRPFVLHALRGVAQNLRDSE
jgi:hypothetical protein